MFRLYRTLLLLAMLGITAAIAAGFLGRLHPAFDTIANFRLHLSVLLIGLAALWSLKCSRVPAVVFALAGFAGVFASAPGLPMTSHEVTPAGGERVYRLFVMNLLWNNGEPERVLELIDAHDPDILYLTEVSSNWRKAIASLKDGYPHAYHCAEWRTVGGSVILSRLPMTGEGEFCGDYASTGLTRIVIGGRKVAAGVVHLRWPWPASGPRQVDALTPVLRALGPDALIAGDFNSTTWSHTVRRFAAAGGLTTVAGIGPSWGPSLNVAGRKIQWPPRLGLPIDNAMSKGAVRVVGAKALPAAGSDHLPFLVDFVMRD